MPNTAENAETLVQMSKIAVKANASAQKGKPIVVVPVSIFRQTQAIVANVQTIVLKASAHQGHAVTVDKVPVQDVVRPWKQTLKTAESVEIFVQVVEPVKKGNALVHPERALATSAVWIYKQQTFTVESVEMLVVREKTASKDNASARQERWIVKAIVYSCKTTSTTVEPATKSVKAANNASKESAKQNVHQE